MIKHKRLALLFTLALCASAPADVDVGIRQHIDVGRLRVQYACTLKNDYGTIPDWIENCNRKVLRVMQELLPDKGFRIAVLPDQPFPFGNTDEYLALMQLERNSAWESLEITSAWYVVIPVPVREPTQPHATSQ